LWISTLNGLSKFNPETKTFNNYFVSDGIPSNNFTWLSHHKGITGEMFFGTYNGLFSFYPDSIFDNPIIPPVVFTSFKLFNQPIPIAKDSPLKKSITETREIDLTYKQNYLAFEFAALNFINSEENRYKYRMEGLEKNWIDAGHNE